MVLVRLSDWLCRVIIVLTVLLITAEVICRNFFHFSLMVTDELSSYALVAIAFLGVPVAQSTGGMFRADMIRDKLSARAQARLDIFHDILSLGFALIVAWQATRFAFISFQRGDVAATALATPQWIPRSFIAIGMVILCFALIRTIVAHFQNGKGE